MALLADGPLCDDLYRSNKMGYGRDFSSVPDPDPDPDSDLQFLGLQDLDP